MMIRNWFRGLAYLMRPTLWGLGLIAVIGTASAQPYGKLSPLYQFTGGADGAQPVGGVVRDADGTLFGETSLGGSAVCNSLYGDPSYGCGTIYSFSTAMGLKVLANFSGSNGAHGQGTLTSVGNMLYGTTYAGGVSDLGTIFSIEKSGANFRTLHTFTGIDGKRPFVQLLVGKVGTLYGVTQFGGATDNGVLFSLAADGTFSIIHDFSGGSDGSEPFSLILSKSGSLLGSTFFGGGTSRFCSSGCGILFQYEPTTNQFSVPYNYTTGGGAGGIVGGVAPGQTVYGANENYLYTVDARAGFVDRGDFNVLQQGAVDSAPLLLPDGSLLGVNGPGANQTVGTIYSANRGIVSIRSFFGGNPGAYPFSQPILMPGNVLIGTATEDGKCSYCGTIWISTPP